MRSWAGSSQAVLLGAGPLLGTRLASGAGMVTISERPVEAAASSWRRC
jgi:hypothetical protein